MTRFSPYLNFPGTARQAMEHYHSVLGGELQFVRFGDFPGASDGLPAGSDDLIMHACLTLPNGSNLMASDAPSFQDEAGEVASVVVGNSAYVMLDVASAAEAERLYAALSLEAARIEMPLGNSGFAELYAAFQDRYGVLWMIHYAGEASADF